MDVEEIQEIQVPEEAPMTPHQSNDLAVRAVAAEMSDVQNEKLAKRAYSEVSKSAARAPTSTSIQFDEKEFQNYCRQNADKNVCEGRGAIVKLSFVIDKNGKPTKPEFEEYDCEEAKKEIENLLSSSPVWTKTNRKVSMTIEW